MEIIIIDEIDDKGRDFTFDVQGSTTIDELKDLYFSEIKNLCKSVFGWVCFLMEEY